MEVLSEPDSSLIIELLLRAGPAGFPVVLTLDWNGNLDRCDGRTRDSLIPRQEYQHVQLDEVRRTLLRARVHDLHLAPPVRGFAV
jgi:hypothetical protein